MSTKFKVLGNYKENYLGSLLRKGDEYDKAKAFIEEDEIEVVFRVSAPKRCGEAIATRKDALVEEFSDELLNLVEGDEFKALVEGETVFGRLESGGDKYTAPLIRLWTAA